MKLSVDNFSTSSNFSKSWPENLKILTNFVSNYFFSSNKLSTFLFQLSLIASIALSSRQIKVYPQETSQTFTRQTETFASRKIRSQKSLKKLQNLYNCVKFSITPRKIPFDKIFEKIATASRIIQLRQLSTAP